uniref:Noggin n=1 Tax=Cyclopterus lumpus TaxID=8103 RepID=A0A8C2YY86_CYCLU
MPLTQTYLVYVRINRVIILQTCCICPLFKRMSLRDSLLSYLQPVPPYTLLTNAEDYHYMPKPRHRRPSRLLRLLGSSFDLFRMSIEQPSEVSGCHRDGQSLGNESLSLPSHVASSVRNWLVRSATCGLSYQWVDLGPFFSPRWLRQTDCEKSDGVRSCSFPAGMECVGVKSVRSDGRNEMGTGEVMKRCIWRHVPYPVVTACTCSCK